MSQWVNKLIDKSCFSFSYRFNHSDKHLCIRNLTATRRQNFVSVMLGLVAITSKFIVTRYNSRFLSSYEYTLLTSLCQRLITLYYSNPYNLIVARSDKRRRISQVHDTHRPVTTCLSLMWYKIEDDSQMITSE